MARIIRFVDEDGYGWESTLCFHDKNSLVVRPRNLAMTVRQRITLAIKVLKPKEGKK